MILGLGSRPRTDKYKRRQIDIEPRKRLGHDEQETLSKEQYHLDQQCRGLKSDHPSSTRQQAIVLGRISIRKR